MQESNTGDGDGGLSGDGSGSGDDEYNYDQYDQTGPELSKGMLGFVCGPTYVTSKQLWNFLGILSETFDRMVDKSIEYSADPGENGNDPSSMKHNRGPTSSKPPTRVSTLLMPSTCFVGF